jgi:AraC-like DNA-binding protein
LEPYVESLWVFESSIGLPVTDGNLAAPNGCSKLTFAYGNCFTSITNGETYARPAQNLHFVGIRDSSIILQSSGRWIGCIGVEFRPHGAFPIFGIPMDETANLVGNADIVGGRWARHVQEELNELRNADERVRLIQRELIHLLRKTQGTAWLRRQQAGNMLVAHCVEALELAHGRVSVRELEQRTGYSRRYLDLLFKQHVGLPPKVLAAILRFRKFYRGWAEGRAFDLVKDELYEHYYDQSHFTKEFKRMTGRTPHEFFQKASNEFGRRMSLR